MVEAYYEFCHNTLGVHMYTIPLIIAAVLAVLFGLLHWRKQNKREREFQDDMEKKYNSNVDGATAGGSSRTA